MCVCVGGGFASDNSEGWHLAVRGLNSLTLSTRPLNPCRGREEQGSARCRTNLLSLMARRLHCGLLSLTAEREKREREREREEASEGGFTLIYLITRTLICFKTAEGGKMSWEDVNMRSRWLLYLQTESFPNWTSLLLRFCEGLEMKVDGASFSGCWFKHFILTSILFLHTRIMRLD